jgi:hypothetical protein
MNLGRMALAGRCATAKAAARNAGFKLRIDCGYNSLVVGKMQGISAIQPISPKIRLENIC